MSTGYFEFWFRSRVHCAAGAVVRLPALLDSLGARRVLLISDAGLQAAGIVDRVASVFAQARSGTLPQLAGIFAEISADAGSETVNAALRRAREVGADAIVALGGGSVLDAAKGVKYALGRGLADIGEALEAGMKMEAEGEPFGVPHVAIPTTAGTGAEVTNGGVIYDERSGQKVILLAPYLEADIVILDAQLTLGLPPRLTADTGMDALTHALEVLCSPVANHFTDALAYNAIHVIERALPRAIADGRDVQAREDMLQAASMACLALVNAAGAAPVHNCSHALGALYHLPHGRANGVLLPLVMEELIEFYLPHAERLARAFALPVEGRTADELVRGVIARIKALQDAIGMPRDFAEYQLPADQVENVVRAIMTDPLAIFYSMPVERAAAIVMRALAVPAPAR